MRYGKFDDSVCAFLITDPLPPRAWINYLGNRRLHAFISQNAGGLLWLHEPYTRRITRYHFLAAPPDRPGFYIYLRDLDSGSVWNPHFAPVCAALESFSCRHEPGITAFFAAKDGIAAEATYAIAPTDDAMIWLVRLANRRRHRARLACASYMEFGLLEFMREAIGWCYLKSQFSLDFEARQRAIRYDYHVFEAPAAPAMIFACTAEVTGFECSRDAFLGRTGSLADPAALAPGRRFANSRLPSGGHACAVLGTEWQLQPDEEISFAYVFAAADTWQEAWCIRERFADVSAAERSVAAARAFYRERLQTLQVEMPEAAARRFINVWNPFNCLVACEHCRIISTDHMGTDGLRFRDTSQDAMAVAHIDQDFARSRLRLLLEQQTADGGGCMSFFPLTHRPTTDAPQRSDNGIWPVYTVKAILAETGDWSLLTASVPYRDRGAATIYEHLRLGLEHIWQRRGPHGLPYYRGADWNDGLALHQDPQAESVMLGMQLAHAAAEFADIASRLNKDADAAWAKNICAEMTEVVNSDAVWDGAWYRRLLLSNGKIVGGRDCRQGRIFLEPQVWAVISGVGQYCERGRQAMAEAHTRLSTPYGLAILTPPYQGFPEPEDPPLGSNPGIGENGGIFCHCHSWAVIAASLLGENDRAWQYYTQILPENVIASVGEEIYAREPYVYVSSLVGPENPHCGAGGISWLTGTASWMYMAVTQYILGIRPVYDGLLVQPRLPAHMPRVTVRRHFRGCLYTIEIENQRRPEAMVIVDGQPCAGGLVRPFAKGECHVRCLC